MEIISELSSKKHLVRKVFMGFTLGLVLAIIVLNVDKKLWQLLELETVNGRNTSVWFNNGDTINRISIKDIVVILFDDKTQFLLRQKGLPIKDFERKGRNLIKSAIEKLESYSVRSIGINLNLSSPSETKSDDDLAKTISTSKNIVIADSIYSSYPASSILKNTSSIGFGELYPDYDKIVHKVNLFYKDRKNNRAFSYALFKASSSKNINETSKNEFYLKYPKTFFTKYSFIDLVQEKIKPASLKDKVVILGIGLNSKLMKDQLLTPFRKDLYISDSEVQAIALTNLLDNSYLSKLSLSNYPLAFIILSMFLGAIFSSIVAVRRLILGTMFFIFLVVSSQITYSHFQVILELVPILFLLIGNLVIGSIIFLQLDLQEQNIELENSHSQLRTKNIQLTNTLTELHDRVNELKEVRRQLSKRSEEERKRIARELHDDTLARLTDLRRYIESVIYSREYSISDKKQMGVCVQILDNASHEIRRIINALRPSMLDNILGLLPAIENLLDELSKRSNYRIKTKLTTSLSSLKLQELAEINLYRIIQEALNNVLKHSHATKAEILIEKQPGQLLVLVNDNGSGFTLDPEKKNGFGLVDMKERAELIGVTLQYLNKPNGSGTTLEITIPLDKVISRNMPWHVSVGIT